MVLTDLGRTAEAVQNAEEALRRVREIGAQDEELGTYTILARCYLAHGDPEKAASWLELGRSLPVEHDVEGYGSILTAWAAQVAARRGDREVARTLVDQALNAQDRGWQHQETRLKLIAARTLALLDDREAAKDCAEQALQNSEACGYRYYALKAHHILARLATDEKVAKRHERIGRALQRSLAGNLSPDDAESFNRIIEQTLPGF
jgi:pentatricopeptide repeat protein